MAGRKTTPEFKAIIVIMVLVGILILLLLARSVVNSESPDEAKKPEKTSDRVETSEIGDTPGTEEPPETADDGNPYAAEKNYIEENLERYTEYQKNNPTSDASHTVTMVNIGLDREFYTYTEAADTSLGLGIVVNKYNYLTEDYEPEDLVAISDENSSRGGCKLRSEAAGAFEKFADAAREQGYSLLAYSGFRTYGFQSTIYNNLLKSDTEENVDTYSARPGYSEHQTGLAMDVCTKDYIYTDFDKDGCCEWAHENAHKYGFIVRYTEDNQPITGYMAEAWHFRYVGVEAATLIYENGLTFEEYYDLYVRSK